MAKRGQPKEGTDTIKHSSKTGFLPTWLLAASALVLAISYAVYRLTRPPVEITPLNAPLLTSLPEFAGEYRNSMMWGSYRSGLYFGMRTRMPQSLLAGLMWMDPQDPSALYQERMRHEAQAEDGLQSYGWLAHDGTHYGRQQLLDGDYNLSVSMLKQFGDGSGPAGDWSVRVSVTASSAYAARPASDPRAISLFFYLADEGQPSTPWNVADLEDHDRAPQWMQLMKGGSKGLGDWAFYFSLPQSATEGGEEGDTEGAERQVASLALQWAEKDKLLFIKRAALMFLARNWEQEQGRRGIPKLPGMVQQRADVAIFQISGTLPLTVDFSFVSNARGRTLSTALHSLSGVALTSALLAAEASFSSRFAQRFAQLGGSEGALARAALSNLLGSAGYFYGQSQVRMPGLAADGSPAVAAYWPAALYSCVPSRSFFPRGFLWDEGFHQLLLQRWSSKLSRDVLAHWLDLMNAQGWIPREQILGAEAMSRVPPEYIMQTPSHANPPSLFLPIAVMARAAAAATADGGGGGGGSGGGGRGDDVSVEEAQERAAALAWLRAAWPRLQAWFHWYNTTQAGQLPGSYRWRGRDATTDRELNPKTLMSGLDDYPRASHPGDSERHLDLRCWMAVAAQAMALVGQLVGGRASIVAHYRATSAALSSLSALNALHRDPASGMYLDWGNHSEGVRLEQRSVVGPDGRRQDFAVRVVLNPPEERLVPHYGYVSLFPLLACILPHDSPELGEQLALLRRPDLLWTPHGLRSLSASSSLYARHNTPTDPPYWRGAVWINVNFLALRALRHYAGGGGPHAVVAAQAAEALRSALMGNVGGQYASTGYLWEQYDDVTGGGKGSRPFTGWTALIALIAADHVEGPLHGKC